MNYSLITSNDPDKLVEMVNKALSEGWRVVGGIAATAYLDERDGYTTEELALYQAMTKWE